MGNIAVFNICFALNGTFSGTTGWQPIFNVPNGLLENGEAIQFPYFLSGKNAQNESYDLLNGRFAYLSNGQQLAMSWIQYQIIGIIH